MNHTMDSTTLRTFFIPEGTATIDRESPFYEKEEFEDAERIVIPTSVTTIGERAFGVCSLEEIDLPASVTTIRERAFCCGLKRLHIPSSVTEISELAFWHCPHLQAITVDEGNPAFCSIDGILFSKDRSVLIKVPKKGNLVSYTVPDSVRRIGDDAFAGCSELRSVVIPASVTSIGGAFESGWCDKLERIAVDERNPAFCDVDGVLFDKGKTRLLRFPMGKRESTAYRVPDGVRAIGGSAFNSCDLQHIELPDSVAVIGDDAFSLCTDLQSIRIPDPVTVIGEGAFRSCRGLQEIRLPSRLTAIGAHSFTFCQALTDIVIPDSVTSVGEWAFSCCASLQHIRIPRSVTAIGTNAFECSARQGFSVADGNPQFTAIDGVLFSKDRTQLIQMPTRPTSDTYAIPYGTTTIGERAFSGNETLKTVLIPDSVTEIGQAAFSSCTALQRIALPASVTAIRDCTFDGCDALEHVDIPDSVTSIGLQAFFVCTSLRQIVLPDSVTSVAGYAFYQCEQLESVRLPASITAIEERTFDECYVLRSAVIPDSVAEIANHAFAVCRGLQEVTLPASVTFIGRGAFFLCRSLRSIRCHIRDLAALKTDDAVFHADIYDSATLYVPAGMEQDYRRHEVFGKFRTIAPLPATLAPAE